MKKRKEHSKRGGQSAPEDEKTGTPKLPKERIKDLDPEEQEADAVKGGAPKCGGSKLVEY
jgi:hypothetical protein